MRRRILTITIIRMPATKSATGARKLSHSFRLFMSIPGLFQPTELIDGNKIVICASAMTKLTAKVNIVPFWLEKCPPEHEETWGKRWDDIYGSLHKLTDLENKTEVDKFDWKKNGLEDVLEVARKNKWDSFADFHVIFFKLYLNNCH
jgi:hypothetical protein